MGELSYDKFSDWKSRWLFFLADDHRTSVTSLDLVVKKKRFCNQKYEVRSSHRNYLTIMASLPNLFEDKSVFCASNQGQDSGTCGGDSG